jgi:hypothetical protein
MSPIKGLIAVQGSKVDPKDILGFLTMYSIPDRMVEYHEVVKQWTKNSLDTGLLPKPGKPIDVFQLACSAVQSKRVRGAADEILAQRAFLSTQECVYQITHSVRDSVAKLVDHPKAMSIKFVVNGERITVERREEYDALSALEQKVRTNYRDFKTQIAGSKVRTGVRETIVNRLGGTNYMGKGIYMVPSAGLPELEAIQVALAELYGGDAHISLIPMLNTDGNRDDLSRFHADDIRERSEALMATIAEKLKVGGTVRKDMLGNVVDEMKALKDQRDRIFQVIGTETAAVESRLKAVAIQVEALTALSAQKEAA